METIVGLLLVLGFAYCGWRGLLLGKKLQEKVHGEPKPPLTLFTSKSNSQNDKFR